MTRLLHLIIYIIMVCAASPLCAQNDEYGMMLTEAEENYRLGRFDQALEKITANINAFKDTDKQKVLRLIALCYLAQDKEEEAEQYARRLVELNNYYNSVDDPVRFEDMVNRLKAGRMATVTTASNVSESITEAPVPVTIITAEMIENLGYNKSLNQILATYVPGMNEIYSEATDNMAMHGAFSAVQELILVMENGHRLNDRIFNSCPMDYAISTEKIDHIEVLRGPASSLYGNVALSAVVNIITKDGADINGVKVKYGHGSFGTHKADLTAGTRFMEADILVWASLYKSDGQARQARDSTEYKDAFDTRPATKYHAYVDGYKDTPSYDVGLSLKLKGFNLMLSRKNSKKMFQYGNIWGYYNYDLYRAIDGIKPGKNRESNLVDLTYTKMLGNVSLNAGIYGDWATHVEYSPMSIEVDDESLYESYTRGSYLLTKMQERAMGCNLRASTAYKLGGMNGDLLMGGQFEHFKMSEYYSVDGENYDGQFKELNTTAEDALHTEKSLSVYAQGKHRFTQQLILNAGLRYDVKFRARQDNAKALSPRLALIYAPKEAMSLKLAYSRAFVDMSYYNRIIKYGTFIDSGFLPQYLTALQLVMMGKIAPLHLAYDVNIFYNRYENLYLLGYSEDKKVFENEGIYKCVGVELSARYNPHPIDMRLNFYWAKVLKAKNYYYSPAEDRIAAVPRVKANLNVAWKALERKNHELKIYANALYQGAKLITCKKFQFDTDDEGWYITHIIDYNYYTGATVRLDAGVKYTFRQRLQMAVDVENILDTDHFLLGPQYSMYPYHQRGRNIMASVAYTF